MHVAVAGDAGRSVSLAARRKIVRQEESVLVAFALTPLGAGDSVSPLIAEAVRIVRDSGLPTSTDAMFTTIEGEWDEVMPVIKAATDAVTAHAPRVSLVLRADIRPGATGAMRQKLESLERELQK